MASVRRIGFIAVLVAIALASGVLATASQAGTRASLKAKITSVTFTGTPAKPTLTIRGRGLSVPLPNPTSSPSNQPLCPRAIPGNAGFDYGVGLYVLVFANGKQTFAAGRYRPSKNELDCVGLIVLSHSPREIRLRFGAAYRAFGYQLVVNGTRFTVAVGGAVFRGVVRYR